MFSSTMRNTNLKLQQTQEYAIIRTALYSLTVGKGGCHHPTSQGDNYTHYYQPLQMSHLGIRETTLYYNFSIKNSLPGHFQVTKDSTGSALHPISWGTKYLRADFPCSPFVHTQLHTRTLQMMACQSFVLANTLLFCWHKQATCSYLFCPSVSIWKI